MSSKKNKMASYEMKVDYMMKRSQSKSTFTIENYKSRWFVLDPDNLKYYDGSLQKRGKQKGCIPLLAVKSIECVDNQMLDSKDNVFQVVYAENQSYFTMYIVSLNDEQRHSWIEALKDAAGKKNCQFLAKYHRGAWTKTLGRYNCCDQIDRNAPGCELTTQEKALVSRRNQSSGLGPPPSIPPPEIPKASANPSPQEKKIYIAAYDYKPAEEGDLELHQGEEYEILDDSRDHWWLAKDITSRSGQTGYIPSNYVKKKFDLEIYEWYYNGLSRERSEAILMGEKKEGCFMVRTSSTAGMYTLSVYTSEGNGLVRHYHIKKKPDEQFYMAEKHAFPSIPELIYYHKHNSGGLATRLKSPPSKSNKSAPTTAGFGHSKWEIDRNDLDIGEILGAGCFGTVHKGKWRNRTVALKMMKERTMSEESFVEEAYTMTQLSHQNLVQLYGVVTKTRPLIIVTELMQYGSLLTYLRRHKARLLSKTTTLLEMCVQVCRGMSYLEMRRFIHRDLAARNCLVGDNLLVKVADFGLARYVIDDDYTSSTGTKFPVKWAPPEVLSYTRFSSKSDIWAFGILMWEIFTGGVMPYENMRNADVVDFVCHSKKRLEKPASCPEKIHRVMLECWQHDAENRPTFQSLSQTLGGLMESGDYPFIS